MRADESVGVYIDAVYPVLLVITHEEDRVQHALIDLIRDGDRAQGTNTFVFAWSATSPLHCVSSTSLSSHDRVTVGNAQKVKSNSPVDVLKRITEMASAAESKDLNTGFVWILTDLIHFLTTGNGYLVQRLLRDAAHAIAATGSRHTIIILDSQMEIPPRIEKIVTVVDWPLPDREEIGDLFDTMAKEHRSEIEQDIGKPGYEQLRYDVSNAALGLSQVEVDNVLAKSHSLLAAFDPKLIIQEKRQLIRKRGHLEYWEAEGDLSSVGGVGALKEWLAKRRAAFSEAAVEYGLKKPKGLLLVGVPGCGKSYIAKSVGQEWNMPVLRLDIGKMMGSYIGQSERQLREALALAETMAPCVLWCDELEKNLPTGGERDSGTSSRVLSTWLTWMQEKKTAVFVVATANAVDKLPAEVSRKGRFDEIFFVDLPTLGEREEIFTVHIRKTERDLAKFDIARLARSANDFSGGEIEALIHTAMFNAFDQGRDYTTQDVLSAMSDSTKIATTQPEKLEAIREWAKTRGAKRASFPPEEENTNKGAPVRKASRLRPRPKSKKSVN